MTTLLRPSPQHKRKGVPVRSPRKEELSYSPGVVFSFPMLPTELSVFESQDRTQSPWVLAGSWPVRSAGLSSSQNLIGRLGSACSTASPTSSTTDKYPAGRNGSTNSKRSTGSDSVHSSPLGKRSIPSGSLGSKKARSSSVTSRSSPRIRPRSSHNSTKAATASPVRHSSRRLTQPSTHAPEATTLATPDLAASSLSDGSIDESLSLTDDGHSTVDSHSTKSSDQTASRPSASTSGRKPGRRCCISCKNYNTPCWRPGWDNTISLCNSCGLRYKKSKIYCRKCLYVPLKSEIQEPKHICTKCSN